MYSQAIPFLPPLLQTFQNNINRSSKSEIPVHPHCQQGEIPNVDMKSGNLTSKKTSTLRIPSHSYHFSEAV